MPAYDRRRYKGRGGLDFGGLFEYLGQSGVAANPEYGKEPGQVDFTYKGDPSELVRQPVVAKNIFAKPYAAQYSADLAADLAKAKGISDITTKAYGERTPLEVERVRKIGETELNLRKEALPFNITEKELLGGAESKVKLDLEKQLSKIKSQEGWDASVRAFLLANNIPPTKENFTTASDLLSQQQLNILASQGQRDISQAVLAKQKADIEQNVQADIAETERRKAIAASKFGAEVAEKSIPLASLAAREAELGYLQRPARAEAEISGIGIRSIGPSGLYDVPSGKVLYEPQSLFEKYFGDDIKAKARTPTPPASPSVSLNSGRSIQLGPNGEILVYENGRLIRTIPQE